MLHYIFFPIASFSFFASFSGYFGGAWPVLLPMSIFFFSWGYFYKPIFTGIDKLIENQSRDDFDSECEGRFVSIEPESFRYEFKRHFRVKVAYKGITKVFRYIPEDLSNRFRVGRKLVVKYSSSDLNDSKIDAE